MIALSAFTIAIFSPLLGRWADTKGHILNCLKFSIFASFVFTSFLWFVEPKVEFAILAICLSFLSIFFSEISFIFYNALLSHNFKQSELGKISGLSWGLGYFGGIASLIIILVLFILPEKTILNLDKTESEHIRISMPLVAIWLLVFSIPIMTFFSNPKPSNKRGKIFSEFVESINRAKKTPSMVRFLFARMFYNDGLITLFAFGGIFAAKVFKFTQNEILIFAILLNLSSGIGAILSGVFNNKNNSITIIRVSLLFFLLLGSICIFTTNNFIFWISAISLGFFVGPCQSASRVWVSLNSNNQDKASIFGLYMTSGKITSFIGPLIYGWLVYFFGLERYGMISVLILIFLGLIFLPKEKIK